MKLQLDNIIELLIDGKWHAIEEISQKSKLHEFKIEILTQFLADYSFLEFDKKRKQAKLSKVFAAFLKKAGPPRTSILT